MITLGAFLAFLSACTWAIGSANYSRLAREHSPFDVNFTRAIFALPLFILATIVTSGGLEPAIGEYSKLYSTQSLWLVLSILSSYAIGDVLFVQSTISLGVPGALAIASGYPILTALQGHFFEGQTLHGIQWLGLILSVGGIVLVILNDPKGVSQSGSEVRSHPVLRKKWVGIVLASLTAVAWATNGYSVSRGGQGLNPAVGNTFRMLVALPLIATLSSVFHKRHVHALPRNVLRKFAWVFIVESFLGSYFFLYGLTHTPLVVGNTLASLAPVLSVPVAVMMKLERFSWVRTLAVLTVVVGLSLLFR